MTRLQKLTFPLRGEHIALDALLKATGAVESGGAAKQLITEGHVEVDGRPELRRSAKLRLGQVVSLTGWRITVAAQDAAPTEPAPPAED